VANLKNADGGAVTFASVALYPLSSRKDAGACFSNPAFNRSACSGMVVRPLKLVMVLMASPVRHQFQYRW